MEIKKYTNYKCKLYNLQSFHFRSLAFNCIKIKSPLTRFTLLTIFEERIGFELISFTYSVYLFMNKMSIIPPCLVNELYLEHVGSWNVDSHIVPDVDQNTVDLNRNIVDVRLIK